MDATSAHPLTDNLYVTLACGLVVSLYAAKRYNTPQTNRLSTTRSLFFLTAAGYVFASLILFLLLCEVVLGPGVLTFLGLDDAQKAVTAYAAPPVLAAVILTTLLPNIAVLSTADSWLLERFQTWGRIPQGVRTLADKLPVDSLQMNGDDVGRLRQWIFNETDIPNEIGNDLGAQGADSAPGTLSRVVRLFSELRKLAASPAYKGSFRSQQEAWQAIQANFEVFIAESQAFFVLFERLNPLDGKAGEEALRRTRTCYRGICEKSYREMTEFLAQLLLIVEATDARIDIRLQSIGFLPPKGLCPRVDIGPILFMGFIMTVCLLALVAIVLPPQPSVLILPLPMIAILIGATRTIGVMTAVLPKLRWDSQRAGEDKALPYLSWLGWAFLAGVISFLTERTAIAMAHHTLSAELDFAQYPFSPMAPLAFATSLVIAILCDVDLPLRNGLVRRFVDGLLCAAALTMGMLLCIHLLDLTPATEGQAASWLPLAISSSLGFLCGFIVPHLYRGARSGGEVGGSMIPSRAATASIG